MANDRWDAAFRQVQTLFEAGTVGALSDRQLLECYSTHDGPTANQAFQAIVARHGSMVLRVCAAFARNEHDAHDAFQATFLVLMQRASTLWVRDSLGPWLHQVAVRVSRSARVASARRDRHERRAAARSVEVGYSPSVADDTEAAVHEEIERLPVHLRRAIVLCHFEGLTQAQVARQLGWPLGTVQSRLARGRERLRVRLARRGVVPAIALVLGAEQADAGSTAGRLMSDGVRRLSWIRGIEHVDCLAGGEPSIAAVSLSRGVIRMMWFDRLRRVAAGVLLLGVVGGVGAAVVARQPGDGAQSSPPPAHERAMKSLPDYVVEPPDLLRIEMHEALPDKPISGEQLVQPDGSVSLGYYGKVYVAGLTTSEIKQKLIAHLRKYLSDERLGLVLLDPARPGWSKRVSAEESTSLLVEVSAYNSKAYYVLGAA